MDNDFSSAICHDSNFRFSKKVIKFNYSMDSYFVVCNCPSVIFVTLNFLLIYVIAK
jgi:hypothetical protein